MTFAPISIEKVRQIDDLGLARRVLDHGLALGQYRRHHEILRAGHGHGVEHQSGAFETFGAGADVAAFDVDCSPHGLKAGDVDVHRPGADRAAPGQ